MNTKIILRCAVFFDQFVEACSLEILEVSSVGVFLCPRVVEQRQGSTFCFRLADYKSFDDPHDRVLHGAIQLVLASYVFPTPERLDDPIDSLGSPVRVSEFVEHLDQLLEQFRQSLIGCPLIIPKKSRFGNSFVQWCFKCRLIPAVSRGIH